MKTLLGICGSILLGACAARANGLIVHEWGTMTSLEDENGQPLAGINADDEPVPAFVHRLVPGLVAPGYLVASKGVPRAHPDVTVRLETPVLYVHAPAGFAGPLDVQVKYPGGWLTEFYPNAQTDSPGIDITTGAVGHIGGVGTLHWAGLKIGGNGAGPNTTDRVWLSPRNVVADNVSTVGGESEKFLFYRGVGREGQILGISRDKNNGTYAAFPRYAFASTTPFWLADIRPDGTSAFQLVGPYANSRPFEESDYSAGNVAALRASLEAALIKSGLYKDESEALLNTWEVSYFKNPGLRAFYLMPRHCIDLLLPLTVSPAADITRVMVGRIELVTPEQRRTMASIGNSPDAPELYFGLGRFRDALLLDEDRRNPSPGLDQFMQQMGVAFYKP